MKEILTKANLFLCAGTTPPDDDVYHYLYIRVSQSWGSRAIANCRMVFGLGEFSHARHVTHDRPPVEVGRSYFTLLDILGWIEYTTYVLYCTVLY